MNIAVRPLAVLCMSVCGGFKAAATELITGQTSSYCVVIYFWSSGSIECTCMLLTFENGVSFMR